MVDITIDTASNAPCVADFLLRQHPTLKDAERLAVPRNEINIRSADGSKLEILGCIRFETYIRRYYSTSGSTRLT